MPYQRRIYHILESMQYGSLYFIAGFFAGSLLDRIFPMFDEKKSSFEIAIESILQGLLVVLLAYYLRYRIKKIPLFFHTEAVEGYAPYGTPEYGGELMIAVAFVGSQFNLIRKVDVLSRRLQGLLGRHVAE